MTAAGANMPSLSPLARVFQPVSFHKYPLKGSACLLAKLCDDLLAMGCYFLSANHGVRFAALLVP